MSRKAWASTALALAVAAGALATGGGAAPDTGADLTPVPAANARAAGFAPANTLSPEVADVVVAQGSTRLENQTALIGSYGYENDVVDELGQPVMVPAGAAFPSEAQKTEPDKNTYLVFEDGQPGADRATTTARTSSTRDTRAR
jgi:hypothetical protein